MEPDLGDALCPIHFATDPREGLAAVLRCEPVLAAHKPLLEQLTKLVEESRAINQHICRLTEQIQQAVEASDEGTILDGFK